MFSNSYHDHKHYNTNNILDKQVIKTGEVIATAEYPSILKTNTKCYWQQLENIGIFIIATRTIVRTCLDASTIKEAAYIPIHLCNKNRNGRPLKDIQFIYVMQITIIF